jgi:hypothetical protein
MTQLINNFETTISDINGTIRVNYFHGPLTGHCEYTLLEVNNASPTVGSLKRFKQKAWILINTDMGDVIEFIHANRPLNSGDLQDVNKLIRDHSLSRVQSLDR